MCRSMTGQRWYGGLCTARGAPVEKPAGRDEWQDEPVVLVSSFLMRRADRQRELLDAADWDLLILDEAHHARRRGAGSTQEKGPNALLGLMRKLQVKCRSLLLLTATPMQVHPVELWDLMDLLGLPNELHQDDGIFLRYFQRASGNPSPEDLEYLASLFRSTEVTFGEMTEAEATQILPAVSGLQAQEGAEGPAGRERDTAQDHGCGYPSRRYATVAGCEPAASPHGPQHARIATPLQSSRSETRSA
jgi:hypothetical protein